MELELNVTLEKCITSSHPPPRILHHSILTRSGRTKMRVCQLTILPTITIHVGYW